MHAGLGMGWDTFYHCSKYKANHFMLSLGCLMIFKERNCRNQSGHLSRCRVRVRVRCFCNQECTLSSSAPRWECPMMILHCIIHSWTHHSVLFLTVLVAHLAECDYILGKCDFLSEVSCVHESKICGIVYIFIIQICWE